MSVAVLNGRSGWTALSFLLTSIVSMHNANADHRCIHDEIMQRQPTPLTYNQTYDEDVMVYGGRRALQAACTDFATCTAAYQPIRIVSNFDFLTATGTGMTTAKRDYIRDILAPAVATKWGELLSVARVSGSLKAARRCTSAYNAPDQDKCASFATETQCGSSAGGANDDVKIVFGSEMLGTQLEYADYNNPTTKAGGAGVANADFVIFVTAKHTPQCPAQGQSGTLAYALPCQRDQYDRPTWGRVNFCPWAIDPSVGGSTGPDNGQFRVAMHEYAHALGFTSDSWPKFRNWDAERSPKTSRKDNYWQDIVEANKATYSCGGTSGLSSYYADTTNTVAYFAERGASQCTPAQGGADLGACVHKHIGPRTKVAVQQFFDCASLNGAELENHLTTACSFQGSHWEQRIFNRELMGSYLQSTNLISAVTLAMFEDSGWYKADYSKADGFKKGLDWGFKQGCAFAKEKCIDVSGNGRGTPAHFFTTGADDDRCTVDRTAFGPPSIATGQSSIPTRYQYFPSAPGTGGNQNMDYCPWVQGWSNRICKKSTAFDGADLVGEVWGANSACFEKTLYVDGVSGAPSVGCMQYACSGSAVGSYTMTVTGANGNTATCTSAQAGTTTTITGYLGSLTCPVVDVMCAPATVLTPDFGSGAVVIVPPVVPPADPSPSAAATPSPSPSPSMIPVVVTGDLEIRGLDPALFQQPDAPVKTAVINALGVLLVIPPWRIRIIGVTTLAARRLAQGQDDFLTRAAVGVARMLTGAGVIVNFAVDTGRGNATAITTAITNTLVAANPSGAAGAARQALVQQIATAANVNAASLSVTVNAATLAAVEQGQPQQAASTPSSTIIYAVVVAAVVLFNVASAIYWLRMRARRAAAAKIAPTDSKTGTVV